MTPIDIVDYHSALKDWGLLAILCLAIVAFIFWVCKDWLGAKLSRARTVWNNLENRGRRFQELFDKIDAVLERFDGGFMSHVEDTKRAADEEHWKSCQIDRCPYLQKFFESLRDVDEHILHYAKECERSHRESTEAMTIILRRQDELFSAILGWVRKNGHEK